jgi:hypothetical protein
VFVVKGSLILVALSRTGETIDHLRHMLEFLYETLIFFASDRPLAKLRDDPFFDLAGHVGGTRPNLLQAIRLSNRSPALFTDAIPITYMHATARGQLLNAIKLGSGTAGLVAVVITLGTEIVVYSRHPRHPLRPRDLMLLCSFVQSSTTFRSSEAFVPMCLPGVSPSALLHAHVSFLHACRRGSGRPAGAFAEPVNPSMHDVRPETVDDAAVPFGGAGSGVGGSVMPRSEPSGSLSVSSGPSAKSLPERVLQQVERLRGEHDGKSVLDGLSHDTLRTIRSEEGARGFIEHSRGAFSGPPGTFPASSEDAIGLSASAPPPATPPPAAAAIALMEVAEAHIHQGAVEMSEAQATSRLEAFAHEHEELERVDHEGVESVALAEPEAEAPTESADMEELGRFDQRLRATAANPHDDAFLVVIGSEISPDAVAALRSVSTKIRDALVKYELVGKIAKAAESGGPSPAELGSTSLAHFVYLWKPLRQVAVARFPPHLVSHRARKRLLRRYQHLWSEVTGNTVTVRHIAENSPDGTVGAINTTNAVLLCLASADTEPGALVRIMEEFAKTLKGCHSRLLLERIASV